MKKFFLLFSLIFYGTITCDVNDLVEVTITNEQLKPEKFEKLLDTYHKSKKPIKISFSESQVSDLHLAQLLRLQDHIIDLDLSGCKNIQTEQIKLVTDSLEQLETLNIARTNIGDEALQAISTLPKLKKLNLEQCDITDKGLEYLTQPPKVSGIMGLFKQPEEKPIINSLEELNISDIEKITDKSLGYLKNLKKLQKLHVSECHNITNNGIKAVLETMPTLQYLDISLCKKVDVKIFTQISETINKRIMALNKTNFTCIITDEIDFTTEKFQPNKVIVSHGDHDTIFTLIHNGFDATDKGAEQIFTKNIHYFKKIIMTNCEQITNKIFKIITDSLHKQNVSDKIFACKTTTRKLTYFDKVNQILLRVHLPQLEITTKEIDQAIENMTRHATNLQNFKAPSHLKINNKTVKKLFSQNKNLISFNFYPVRKEIESIIQTVTDSFGIVGCEVREERLVHSFTFYDQNMKKKAIAQLHLQPDGKDMEKFLGQITPPLQKKLTELKIHRSAEAGSLKPIAKFTKLKKLNIAYYAKQKGLHEVKLNDAEFAHIQNLADLEELNIAGTDITNPTLALIANKFPKLRRLNVKGTKITGAGLTSLKTLENLKYINLKKTNLKPIDPKKVLPDIKIDL